MEGKETGKICVELGEIGDFLDQRFLGFAEICDFLDGALERLGLLHVGRRWLDGGR